MMRIILLYYCILEYYYIRNDLRFQNKLLCFIVCYRMIDVQGLNEGKDDYPDKPRFK